MDRQTFCSESRKSGFFNRGYYAAQVDREFASDDEAALHYLDEGWVSMANPSQEFSTASYLDFNQDVRQAGLNPLLHYLHYGKREDRRIERGPSRPVKPRSLPAPRLPSAQEWEALAERGRPSAARSDQTVDVVVPIYRGVAETLCCLYSVLSVAGTTPIRLVAVDDHGPEAELRERLEWLAEHDLICLRRTPQNAGFVVSCNLGMSVHPDRDVVLLNSDTEVFDGWLDRLRKAAYRDRRTATVTPFSNNAEICSYPRFVHDNWLPLDVPDRTLDAIMATVNAGEEIEIPTGVGFCLYIRRDYLDAVGLLDHDSFAEGYGEENDLCRRAASAGGRNILAADVFVRHYGGVSFGESKLRRVERAIATVERLHPGYLAEIGRFVAADPIKPFRQAIDAERLRRHLCAFDSRAILFIQHNRGGGTERHVQEMIRILNDAGTPVLLGLPDPANPRRIEIWSPDLPVTPNAPSFDLTASPDGFAAALRTFEVGHVHIHHLAGTAEMASDYLRLAIDAAGLRYDVTIHDYMAFCPRIDLTDAAGVYCGEPDISACQTCIDRTGSPFGRPVVWEWRNRYRRFLEGARCLFVPADDVARRMRRHFPSLRFVTRPHLETSSAVTHPAARVDDLTLQAPERETRVALLGAIGPNKGAAVFLRCARLASERRLPIRFSVLGYTDRDQDLIACGNVEIFGRYADDALPRLICDFAPNVVWFPAVWPETYSYTLSASFAAGAVPVAFDFGAIAERIRRSSFGALIPVDCIFDPERILDHLMRIAREKPTMARPVVPDVTYPSPIHSYYGLGDTPEPLAACDRP